MLLIFFFTSWPIAAFEFTTGGGVMAQPVVAQTDVCIRRLLVLTRISFPGAHH